jgi:hypothetical protein
VSIAITAIGGTSWRHKPEFGGHDIPARSVALGSGR